MTADTLKTVDDLMIPLTVAASSALEHGTNVRCELLKELIAESEMFRDNAKAFNNHTIAMMWQSNIDRLTERLEKLP